MMLLLREKVNYSHVDGVPSWDEPIQVHYRASCWHVAIASMLLCRTRRVQAQPTAVALFSIWPSPGDLARADADELEALVKPCGFGRNRSRQISRFANLWMGNMWTHLRELPGVGVYVADAVGLFCFGDTQLESTDHVLVAHAKTLEVLRANAT